MVVTSLDYGFAFDCLLPVDWQLMLYEHSVVMHLLVGLDFF